MIDFRPYRIAFAPVALALAAVMFSLQGAPEPLEPVRPPAGFDAAEGTATAREIAAMAPDRPPGSSGDQAIADLVAERFATIQAASVAEQVASVDGGESRNVIATLRGQSSQAVVVVAGRASWRGPGAASSAAATGALIELGRVLAATSHFYTYLLVSTPAADGGAEGVAALIDGLLEPHAVEAALVLYQPGAAEPRPPFVIESATGPERSAAQLTATAARAVETQSGRIERRPGAFGRLARLAFPSGLGQQAPLIGAGFDAVAISSAGERPLGPSEDRLEDLSRPVLAQFGRAASSVVEAIDVAEPALEASAPSYLEVGGNLVPGWALALLGLALLCPALVAAVGAIGQGLRRSEHLGAAGAWAASRALPALAGLAALYLLALVGVAPRPAFPFDPGRFGIDARAVTTITLVALAMAGAAAAVKIHRRPALLSRSALLPALGALLVAAGLIAWLANPYLGLLVAPTTHAWLLTAATGRGRLAIAALGAGASLLPLALALREVASALGLGADAPWTFMLMVADGQIDPVSAVALCAVAGGLLGTVIAARRPPATASQAARGRRPSAS